MEIKMKKWEKMNYKKIESRGQIKELFDKGVALYTEQMVLQDAPDEDLRIPIRNYKLAETLWDLAHKDGTYNEGHAVVYE
jgi:hypothetical protein